MGDRFLGRKKNVLKAAKANAQAEHAELNSALVSLYGVN